MVPLKAADVCCGFGGTFCVKYPDISNQIVADKSRAISESGADTLLAGDLGCLMNMAGKLSRDGSDIKVYHAVEVLAGMTDEPALCQPHDRARRMRQTSHRFKANVKTALAEPNLRVALDRTTDLLQSRRVGMLAAFPAYDATREVAQQIKDHTLAHLDHYLEEFERNAIASGAKVHWARTPQKRPTSSSASARSMTPNR